MEIKTGLRLKRKVKNCLNSIRVFGKQKIFCIGFNKTGTTSLKVEMEQLGYIAGNQKQAELLFDDWMKRDFSRIVRYCYTAHFFQDIPFSYPYTYIGLDQAFPGSKFILTVRDDAEQWYNSLINFHGKRWGNGNIPPTSVNLQNANYLYKGFLYHVRMHGYNITEDDPYNKDILIDYYETHIKNVQDYFRHRPDDLIIINLKNKQDYTRFCQFMGVEQTKDSFPWENKT